MTTAPSAAVATNIESLLGSLIVILVPFKSAESPFMYILGGFLLVLLAALAYFIPLDWLKLPPVEVPGTECAQSTASPSCSMGLSVLADWAFDRACNKEYGGFRTWSGRRGLLSTCHVLIGI